MVLDVTYSPQIPETGKPMDIEVQVTGPDPILGATVTATMGKLEQYSLFDNGGGSTKRPETVNIPSRHMHLSSPLLI